MRFDEIQLGHTYAGKGSDLDKTRRVTALDAETQHVVTQVYRADGKDLGESTLMIRTLAQWAGSDVTGTQTPAPIPVTKGKPAQMRMEGMNYGG